MRIRSILLVSCAAVACAIASIACSGGKHHGARTPPTVTALSPAKGVVGTTVVITGDGFGATQGTSHVTLGNATVPVESWSATSITVTVPATAALGPQPVVVTVGADSSGSLTFTVQLPPLFYTASDSSPNFVHAYDYDSAGTLTEVAGSPWPSVGDSNDYGGQSDDVRVTPTGLVLAVNTTSFSVYVADPATGALTTAPGSPVGLAASTYSLAVTADGKRVYVADQGGGNVFGFDLSPNGQVAPISPAPLTTVTNGDAAVVEVTPDGKYLYVLQEQSVFFGFAAASNGTLTPLPGSPFAKNTAGTGGFVMKMSPDGKMLYFGTDTIDAFKIGANGVPTRVGSFGSVTQTGALAVSPDGGHVYAAEYSTGVLHWFTVDPSGALVSESSLATGHSEAGALGVTREGSVLIYGWANGIDTFVIGSAGRLVPNPLTFASTIEGDPSGIATAP